MTILHKDKKHPPKSINSAKNQYNSIADSILSLDTMPERCLIFDNEPEHTMEIRRLIVDNYLVYPLYAKYTVKPFININGTKIYGRESDSAKMRLAKSNITSLKSKSKKTLTVKFSKVTGAQTYEIKYKQSGKNWKTVTTKSLTKTIKNLSSKKKYSVKVRGVYAAGSIGAVSPWSATKTVKVK